MKYYKFLEMLIHMLFGKWSGIGAWQACHLLCDHRKVT